MTGRDGSVIFTVDCDQSNQKRSPTELETVSQMTIARGSHDNN